MDLHFDTAAAVDCGLDNVTTTRPPAGVEAHWRAAWAGGRLYNRLVEGRGAREREETRQRARVTLHSSRSRHGIHDHAAHITR